MARSARSSLVAASAALFAFLVIGTGFANYDTAYSLLWGQDLAHGRLPDFDLPLTPTPHPLATLGGLVLSPFGDGAETIVVVLAFLALGMLAYTTYALGALWFGPAAGVLAALIIITREPVLSFGVRAYIDIPYVAFVLAALLVEARRPRAGTPVFVLLLVAGLLRPEAWLFAAVYWLWLGRGGEFQRRRLIEFAAMAAAGPVLWVLTDLLLAGDPLYSLTGTQENADVLNRKTGLDEVPITVPRRLGEILREPVLLGAAVGLPLTLWLRRERALPGIAAGVIALAAFCVLAAAGLPILGRYLLLPAALLAIFCGAGAFGWLLLERDDPWRRRWLGAAVVIGLALVAFTPKQIDRLDRLRGAIGIQREIRDDLHDIADRLPPACRPIVVPNHRPVPLLALWLDTRPREIVALADTRPARAVFVLPANDRVVRNFILDRGQPATELYLTVAGERVASNRSWLVFDSCGG